VNCQMLCHSQRSHTLDTHTYFSLLSRGGRDGGRGGMRRLQVGGDVGNLRGSTVSFPANNDLGTPKGESIMTPAIAGASVGLVAMAAVLYKKKRVSPSSSKHQDIEDETSPVGLNGEGDIEAAKDEKGTNMEVKV